MVVSSSGAGSKMMTASSNSGAGSKMMTVK
jgi:hypothetical protein